MHPYWPKIRWTEISWTCHSNGLNLGCLIWSRCAQKFTHHWVCPERRLERWPLAWQSYTLCSHVNISRNKGRSGLSRKLAAH